MGDAVGYRKREQKNRYIETLVASWDLTDDDFCSPKTNDIAIKTQVMSSRLLLAWLFKKIEHADKVWLVCRLRRGTIGNC